MGKQHNRKKECKAMEANCNDVVGGVTIGGDFA